MDPIAVVREVADSFAGCVTSVPASPPLDPELARAQHHAYLRALGAGGFTVLSVPADEGQPDGCFIEDVAVVVGDRALATRPGHPSRRGEVGPVAGILAGMMPVEWMQAPATLDGGDVLVIGATVFVGRSSRTDKAGFTALAGFLGPGYRVIPVPVRGVLHLKSAVTALDRHTVVLEPGLVGPAPFAGLRMVAVPADEPHGANVVGLPDGRILASERHPGSVAAISDAGFEVLVLDVSEFQRADGGLTCLSIRVRDR